MIAEFDTGFVRVDPVAELTEVVVESVSGGKKLVRLGISVSVIAGPVLATQVTLTSGCGVISS